MDSKLFNTTMSIMTTLSEVINLLKEKGYTTDFSLRPNYLEYAGMLINYFPESL